MTFPIIVRKISKSILNCSDFKSDFDDLKIFKSINVWNLLTGCYVVALKRHQFPEVYRKLLSCKSIDFMILRKGIEFSK